MSVCAVFVCNKAYFNKFVSTCTQLITNGNYTGPICLVVGDDLENVDCDFIKKNNIIVQYFPDIQFSNHFSNVNNTLNIIDHRNKIKKFQWHKLHLFHTFFKQWNYIFYLDCGITIFSDVSPMIHEKKENTLLAHSDGYPSYEWKLNCQFDTMEPYFTKLRHTFCLDKDYFQTTMMLYDTNIIQEDTVDILIALSNEYPITRTNEQGILSLYFTQIKPCFKQIKTHDENNYFYDYLSRNPSYNYIMLKSC